MGAAAAQPVAPPVSTESAPPVAPAPRAAPLVGVIAASQTLDLAPLVEGRLDQVKAHLGDRVEAGQVVAILETRVWQLELTARQAQLQASEAEHARAVLQLEHAKQKSQRQQQIRSYAAGEEVETAEQGVQLATVDLNLAKAKLAEMKAQVAVATETLEQARIRAPFTGIVSEQYVQPGTLVNRATPILRLVREDLRLRFAVPQALATLLRPGSEVWVHVARLPQPLKGVVDRISPELDPSSRHLRAEARLELSPELRGRIPIGLVVDVSLPALTSPGPTAAKP